jgi:hypothetical protein
VVTPLCGPPTIRQAPSSRQNSPGSHNPETHWRSLKPWPSRDPYDAPARFPPAQAERRASISPRDRQPSSRPLSPRTGRTTRGERPPQAYPEATHSPGALHEPASQRAASLFYLAPGACPDDLREPANPRFSLAKYDISGVGARWQPGLAKERPHEPPLGAILRGSHPIPSLLGAEPPERVSTYASQALTPHKACAPQSCGPSSRSDQRQPPRRGGP